MYTVLRCIKCINKLGGNSSSTCSWLNLASDLSIGKLTFVGRSGTGADVRYTAHQGGEMPELETPQVLAFYATGDSEHKESKLNMERWQVLAFYQQVTATYRK